MGSQSKGENLAYIAGFLDGDGSLMFQIKKRKDGNYGWRFMFTICFYQDARHGQPLSWIKQQFKIGYISQRNDDITELRINGYKQIEKILKNLLPYIKFKKKQATAMLKAVLLLKEKSIDMLNKNDRKRLAEYMLVIQNSNYVTKKKKTRKQIYKILDLTP